MWPPPLGLLNPVTSVSLRQLHSGCFRTLNIASAVFFFKFRQAAISTSSCLVLCSNRVSWWFVAIYRARFATRCDQSQCRWTIRWLTRLYRSHTQNLNLYSTTTYPPQSLPRYIISFMLYVERAEVSSPKPRSRPPETNLYKYKVPNNQWRKQGGNRAGGRAPHTSSRGEGYTYA